MNNKREQDKESRSSFELKKNKKNSKVTLFYLGLIAIALSIPVIALANRAAFSRHLKTLLIHSLNTEFHVPEQASPYKPHLVYVLSGDFEALKERFDVVRRLFIKGIAEKIAVANMPEWHIYSHAHERNLSFEQWVVYTLGLYGIGRDQITFMDVDEGFWGTKSEAVSLNRFLSGTAYQEVVLVSSAYHTRRAYGIFQKHIEQKTISLYIYGSYANWRLRYLLNEVPKLIIYKYFL